MKTKAVRIISIIFLSFMFTNIQAQTYDDLWSDIQKAEQKDMPKSVISICDKIIKKATKEHQSGQLFKAYFYRCQSKQDISPDSIYTELKDVEHWAETASNPTDKMVIHSILANIYASYAAMNSWELKLRTNTTSAEAPDDIREWTRIQFHDAVMKHIDASLADLNLLHSTNTKSFVPFTKLQWASKFYGHDMLHLIAKRALQTLEMFYEVADSKKEINDKKENIYHSLQNIYQSADDKDALVLISLDEIDYRYKLHKSNNTYIKDLEHLLSSNSTSNVCSEIYLKEAQYYSDHHNKIKALDICNNALKLYPKYERINAVKECINEIELTRATLNITNVAYPNSTIQIKVSHCNSKGFTLQLYKVPEGANLEKEISSKNCSLAYSKHFDLIPPKNYELQTDSFSIQTPDLGAYLATVKSDEKSAVSSDYNKILRITRLKLLTLSLGNQIEATVVDGQNGKFIPGATISDFNSSYKLLKQYTTDAEGKVIFTPHRPVILTATKGDDKYMGYLWGYSFLSEPHTTTVNKVVLMTDRSIYRPGQTVYLKGINYDQNGDSTSVCPRRQFSLSLRDANFQEIANKKVTTNEFGSFTSSFILPSSCLNGIFRINTENGSITFRVEEYKRPSFEVKTDELKDTYSIGDTIAVKGNAKTFSGVPLDGAIAKYTITRTKWSWWWRRDSQIIATDSIKVQPDGTFSIPVYLNGAKDASYQDDATSDETDESYYKTDEANDYYTYTVKIDVTSAAGETQTGEAVIGAGKKSMILSIADDSKRLCKDQLVKVVFEAKNLLQKPVDTNISYTLAPLKDKLAGKVVSQGTAASNKEIVMNDWRKLPSGIYQLCLTANDSQGRKAETKQNIVIFSASDKSPADESKVWGYVASSQKNDINYFDAQHPAKFYFGTSCKDATVMINTFANGKRIESRTLRLSNEIKNFEYPYKASYGDGICINFCFVKDENVYQESFIFNKSLPDRNLRMKWSVFRDKLRPGQKEEWRLNISKPDGKPADAELMAYMYDSSLDQLSSHSLNNPLSFIRSVYNSSWSSNGKNMISLYYNSGLSSIIIKSLDYDEFDQSFNAFNAFGRMAMDETVVVGYGRSRAPSRVMAKASVNLMANAAVKESTFMAEVPAMAKSRGTEEESTSNNNANAVRTNFAETAFFYPQLRTDAKGNVSIAFTLPESLTRWKFNSLAHTKDFYTGLLPAEATASKDFMLSPNMPRFVRTGDHTSIAATVSNLTDKAVTGNVKFELFDPTTNQVILTQTKPITIAANKTEAASFDFTVTDRYDILGVRMIAEGGSFSDGEQHLLPVLSDKVMLTESVPLPIRGNETRTFSLDKLFNSHSNTATHRRLTVEYTGNPAWYAVQALPSLSVPDNDNAVSWATVYYANSLASYIANSMPRIKAIFDSWKAQGGNKESFLSNLQKNQELKNILLNESPWVLEAKSEQEQKERLGTLFDLNNLQNMQTSAINKLKQLQDEDGSWSWYKGMPGSRYMTEYIIRLISRLQLLTGQALTQNVKKMQSNGFSFLHKESQEEYRLIRKAEREGQKIKGISYSALRYLYLIAITGENIPSEYRTAYNYFLSKVNEVPTSQDMQEKSLAAIVLKKAGKNKAADEYIQSLREHLTKSDELGMFFDFNDNPFSWGCMHLNAHTAAIEAFDKVANDKATVEEMNIWLLKQKQTQMWDTPVSTADAIYALLERGTDVLSNKGIVNLSFADKTMSTTDKDALAGLSYVKQTFEDNASVDARSIKVEKKDAGIAWGAAYATFREEISRVKQFGSSAFNVKKEMYVKHIVNNVTQLDAIKDKSSVHVGDVVVARLVIQLDRQMDFVQLKEQRGACFEPLTSLSGYHWGAGTGYYEEIKDASTNFFFDSLQKGVYVMEINYRVSRVGNYEVGLSTLQCAYAPEFSTHSDSMRIEVLP